MRFLQSHAREWLKNPGNSEEKKCESLSLSLSPLPQPWTLITANYTTGKRKAPGGAGGWVHSPSTFVEVGASVMRSSSSETPALSKGERLFKRGGWVHVGSGTSRVWI